MVPSSFHPGLVPAGRARRAPSPADGTPKETPHRYQYDSSTWRRFLPGGSSLLTLDDAWAAAELAGLADELRARPRILLFDEATSSLDAEVQETVSRGLESLQATRVVIAHRLSTIRGADRIYVLSRHRMVQEATFGELLDQPGVFRDLARRQMT